MIIIFEGLDRTGKDTQIRLLTQTFYPNKMFHIVHYSGFHKESLTPKQEKEISRTFSKEMLLFLTENKKFNIICNRSYLGEYVYAPLYRKYDPDWIWEYEKKYFLDKVNENDIYLIVLSAEPEILLSRDDKMSHSTDIKDKEEEIKRFAEAYEKSSIKKKILVNTGALGINDVHLIISDFLGVKNG